MLFNFEGSERDFQRVRDGRFSKARLHPWGCSSAGRAPALHAGGQEFDPPHLHQVLQKTAVGSMGRTPNLTEMGS